MQSSRRAGLDFGHAVVVREEGVAPAVAGAFPPALLRSASKPDGYGASEEQQAQRRELRWLLPGWEVVEQTEDPPNRVLGAPTNPSRDAERGSEDPRDHDDPDHADVAPTTRSHVGDARTTRDAGPASTPRPNPAVWPSVATRTRNKTATVTRSSALVPPNDVTTRGTKWKPTTSAIAMPHQASTRDEAEPPPADPREQHDDNDDAVERVHLDASLLPPGSADEAPASIDRCAVTVFEFVDECTDLAVGDGEARVGVDRIDGERDADELPFGVDERAAR